MRNGHNNAFTPNETMQTEADVAHRLREDISQRVRDAAMKFLEENDVRIKRVGNAWEINWITCSSSLFPSTIEQAFISVTNKAGRKGIIGDGPAPTLYRLIDEARRETVRVYILLQQPPVLLPVVESVGVAFQDFSNNSNGSLIELGSLNSDYEPVLPLREDEHHSSAFEWHAV